MGVSRVASGVPPAPLDSAVAAVIDGTGALAGWTREAAELLGYADADVIGRPARALVAPRPARGGRASGAPGGHVLALRRVDGACVDVWVRLLPMSGSTVLAWGLPVDALTAWGDDTSMPRTVLEQDAWQVALVDRDLRLRRWSPAVGRAGRFSAGGRDLLCDMPMMDGSGTGADLLRQVMETGLPVVGAAGVLRAPRPDQSDLVYSLTAAPLYDLRGDVSGAFTSLVDVTERYESGRRLNLVYRASRAGDELDIRRTAEGLVDTLVPALGDLAAVEISEAALQGAEPPLRVHGLRGDFRRIAAKHAHGAWPSDLVQVDEILPAVPDQPGFRELERGTVLVSNDLKNYLGFLGDVPQAARMVPRDLHASIGAALVAQGRVLGYVQVFRTRRPYAFTGHDAKLVKEIITRAALGIDNARRYTREHRVAETLQRSLLPPVSSSTAAAETAGIYLPPPGEVGVGGDWFDVIALSSLRTALVTGDVIGHGLKASTTMARLRTAVQTLADLDLAPDELLVRLDDLVQRMAAESDQPDTLGASVLYAVYDPVGRLCRLASAGHPPPVVVHPDGTTHVVDVPPGPPLGVGGVPFEVAEVSLSPGSVLAMCSDGLLDIVRRGRRVPVGPLADAEAEFAASLRGACRPGRPLREIGEELVDQARQAAERSDDITVLLARTRAVPGDSVAQWRFPPDPAAVAEAREVAVARLTDWGLHENVFATELVVSELVTNAVRYARGDIVLRLVRDRVLVCEVSDSSESQPRLRRAHNDDEGGRGLFLVAQVTTRWGSRYDASGKTIWTEQLIGAEHGSTEE